MTRRTEPPNGKSKDKTPHRSQAADVLPVLRRRGMLLSRDLAGETFVAFRDSRFNRWRVASRDAERELRRLFNQARCSRDAEGRVIDAPLSAAVTKTVIAHLDALASAMPPTQHHVRVAEHAGAYWLDLGGKGWDAVRVTAEGPRVTSGRGVAFLRPRGVLSLPRPAPRVDAMVRLRTLFAWLPDHDFSMLILFLLACLRPHGPYPLLVISGPEGAWKTTLAKLIRSIVDPHELAVMKMPEKPRDFMTAGEHARLLVIDNLSQLSDEQSDLLCQRSDGATAGHRQNYTDRDLAILRSYGPTVLTSITTLVGRADLASRCLFIELTRLAGAVSQLREIEREIAALAPGLLHELLQALAEGLGNLACTVDRSGFRLADFATFSQAAAPAFGLTPEVVAGLLQDQQRRQRWVVVDNDAVAAALLDWIEAEMRKVAQGLRFNDAHVVWQGSMTELLRNLSDANPNARYLPFWPKTAAQLGERLSRLETALRDSGVTVRHRRSKTAEVGRGGARWIELIFASPATFAADTADDRAPDWAEDIDERPDGRLS